MNIYMVYIDDGKFKLNQMDVYDSEDKALYKISSFIKNELHNFSIYTNASEIKKSLDANEVYCALNLYNNSETMKKLKIYLINKNVQ